jgi:hypothetical protein
VSEQEGRHREPRGGVAIEVRKVNTLTRPLRGPPSPTLRAGEGRGEGICHLRFASFHGVLLILRAIIVRINVVKCRFGERRATVMLKCSNEVRAARHRLAKAAHDREERT